MSDSITRIIDLPENGISGNAVNGETNYIPMNVHPNPYGNSGPQIGVPAQPSYNPPPQGGGLSQGGAPPQNIQIQYPQGMGNGETPQYRLPSHDIPMNPAGITQDAAVTPNYVPPPPPSINDYVRDYEEKKQAKYQEIQSRKHREQVADDWFSEFQIPLFIALLFFVFQMPIINTLIHKYFSFLAIYHEDGNFNVYGLLLKSVAFGVLYYTLSKSVDYLTTI